MKFDTNDTFSTKGYIVLSKECCCLKIKIRSNEKVESVTYWEYAKMKPLNRPSLGLTLQCGLV